MKSPISLLKNDWPASARVTQSPVIHQTDACSGDYQSRLIADRRKNRCVVVGCLCNLKKTLFVKTVVHRPIRCVVFYWWRHFLSPFLYSTNHIGLFSELDFLSRLWSLDHTEVWSWSVYPRHGLGPPSSRYAQHRKDIQAVHYPTSSCELCRCTLSYE